MLKKFIKSLIPKRIYIPLNRARTLKQMEKNKKISNYRKIESKINDEYYKNTGKIINWGKPINYTEKLNFSKLYNSSEIKTQLADKYDVRKWVEEKIGSEYLIPILGVYDNFEQIDFKELPDKFVIKCNHDSGSVTICSNKKSLNLKKLKKDYSFFLKRNLAYANFEMHYKDIKPKIIIEKNMGNNIKDYKFLCFNGRVYYCWVDFDRFSEHKRNIYDLNWKLQPFKQGNYSNFLGDVKKPNNFDKMVKIAEILCKGFDHVRVDLYDIDNHIYFGEMTFTNGCGMEPIIPDEYDKMLGDLWNLDISKRK